MTDIERMQRELVAISEPRKMLAYLVKNETLLGYDQYYGDLRAAMLKRAEELSRESYADPGVVWGPYNDFPMHTLEAARRSLQALGIRIQFGVMSETDAKKIAERICQRWPDLRTEAVG